MHTCDAAQVPSVHYIPSGDHSSGNKLKVILKDIIKDPLGTAIDLVFDLGVDKLTNGVEHVVHQLGHEAEHLGNSFYVNLYTSSIDIGKRQSCGDRCPACNNVKSKNLSEIKSKVCGSSYVNRISTLDSLEPKIRKVAAALKNRFIQKIEYDPTSLDPATVQFRNVYVTEFKTGSLTRFKTKAPYQMMHMENTASHWASEALAMFID
ncbi:Hypothetical predicted protein [Mytilus galloprovincialis]|uniref:Uncharacterized protein n=1 Tax=Mytilus galloprovincialis TaxID=29158 RepID=A0A8B6GTZ5_MYTGA|nr:Hypothetical predicted protein [Mytilus galloprovincialis]